MNSVAYLRVEWIGSSEHNPFSPEDQTQFLGENAARLIEQEWNEYGPVVKVDVVTAHSSHSQAFTDMLTALEAIYEIDDYVNDGDEGGTCFFCQQFYTIGGKVNHKADCAYIRTRAAIEKARKEMGK